MHLLKQDVSRLYVKLTVILLTTLFVQQTVWAGSIYTFWRSTDGSDRIFYSYLTDGHTLPKYPYNQPVDNIGSTTWPEGKPINNVDSTSATPAGATFRGKGYVVWRTESGTINYSASSDGKTWPTGKRINNIDTTSDSLALAVFRSKLYLFWKASDNSGTLFYTSSSDGENWPDGKPITGVDSTSAAPSAVVYNDNLYVFWKSNDDSNRIIYTSSPDGKTWPNGQQINGSAYTGSAPSATAYFNNLYVFWQAPKSGNGIFYSASNDGISWPNGQPINNVDSTSATPVAAGIDANLYVVWRANDDSHRIYNSVSTSGTKWLSGQVINDSDSALTAPSLATSPIYTGSFVCDGDGDEDGTCYSPDNDDKNKGKYSVVYATGGNGYYFELGPGEQAVFHYACTYDEIKSRDMDKNDSVKCDEYKESSRHKALLCTNTSKKSHHHVKFKKYHCGPTSGSCDGGNECQQPDNPGA